MGVTAEEKEELRALWKSYINDQETVEDLVEEAAKLMIPALFDAIDSCRHEQQINRDFGYRGDTDESRENFMRLLEELAGITDDD